MLTLFTSPKPFTDPHIRVIQRNALTSWTLLRPRPEIVLFGDEMGTADICRDLGLSHIPAVQSNEFGTPLLDGLFADTQSRASHDLLCYINADIILTGNFLRAVQHILTWRKHFLVIGSRWDVDITEPWDFQLQDWEAKLADLVAKTGQLMDGGSDYFMFPRGMFQEIPPFALGRGAWDLWLLWKARHENAALVDATSDITAIHQNHCLPADWTRLMSAPEAVRNRELVDPWEFTYRPDDATHKLVNGRLSDCPIRGDFPKSLGCEVISIPAT
jgi:hypothetical protein